MTDENRKPLNFDWVSAREKCSLREVFESLKLGIRDDVEKRNATLSFDANDPLVNVVLKTAEKGRTFRVFWDDKYGAYAHLFVELTLTKESIVARDHENILFEAVVGLNDNGDCKLKIQGVEYDPWQVRRRALEQFMFTAPK